MGFGDHQPRAGLRRRWKIPRKERWPAGLPPPDLEFATLAGLADWLDSHDTPETR